MWIRSAIRTVVGYVMLIDFQDKDLHESMEYRDGGLYWTVRTGSAYPGDRVGRLDSQGYRMVGWNGKWAQEHRLIWIYHNGPIPDGMVVDHINRDVSDCRIENLRLATKQENSLNSIGRPSVRISKYKGVSPSGRKRRPWIARLTVNGKQIVKSAFTEEEAARYYNEMVIKYRPDFGFINTVEET